MPEDFRSTSDNPVTKPGPSDRPTASDTMVDLAIIGGGSAGLFATFHAGMRGMSAALLESAPMLGGQPAALYPEKWIYDIPALPRVKGEDLAKRLIEQAQTFEPIIRTGASVIGLEGGEDGFSLQIADGSSLRAAGVLVTAGIGAFEPRRLAIENPAAFEGRGVHYVLRRRQDVAGQRVVVAGGGDAAVDWALM
ncbi:MAG: NAD(P)/FAD-dependent oxidoreductase, partial [Thermaerobacterales bacterium]